MAILMDHHVIEDLAYDEDGKEVCKAKHEQTVHIELDVLDMGDSDTIKDAIKKLGYSRTFFGLTPTNHIKMEFERKK